jgi:hypothetical protein
VNTTGWLKGLKVSSGGTGIVSHAGVALIRALTDNVGLTAACRRRWRRRGCWSMTGRVLADLACAIADGGEAIGAFRVIGDQGELSGLVASGQLALGGRHRHRLGPHHRPRPRPLTSTASARARRPRHQGRWNPGHPARQPGHCHDQAIKSRSRTLSVPWSQPADQAA